jgi:uncharacterized protein (DUF433 family)
MPVKPCCVGQWTMRNGCEVQLCKACELCGGEGTMLVTNFESAWECEEFMHRRKPTRKPGEDLYTFPTFTIPEAGQELGIDGWTLLNWYSKSEPLLHPSGWYGEDKAFALLSFRDLEEAYKLHLLRTKFGQSMQYLHKALTEAGKETNSLHPLIDCKLIVFSYLALDKPARGRGKRKMLPLGFEGAKSQLIPEVVDAWGRRIVADSKGKTVRMYPYRLAKSDDHSRPVSMDPEVLSGRLVVTGTRIPVRVLHSRSLGGETPEQIASDYGISPELVQKALIHFAQKDKKPVHSIS